MTPQEIEKAAEKWADNPEHRHKHKAWMRPSHVDAYISGANLVMERVRKLENALKLIQTDAAICHDDALYTICDAALEGKE